MISIKMGQQSRVQWGPRVKTSTTEQTKPHAYYFMRILLIKSEHSGASLSL
jgi:hypothetical protein